MSQSKQNAETTVAALVSGVKNVQDEIVVSGLYTMQVYLIWNGMVTLAAWLLLVITAYCGRRYLFDKFGMTAGGSR